MKNRILEVLFIGLILGCLFILTACEKESTNSEKPAVKKESETYSFKFSGVDVAPGNKFDENKISEKANISEIPSCAFDGVDKVYTYSNVEIIVADVKGVPTVYSVYFIDETASTDEGLRISDSKDMMIKKYGENYENSLSNKYDYTRGNVTLSFIVENDIITGIEYTLLTNN